MKLMMLLFLSLWTTIYIATVPLLLVLIGVGILSALLVIPALPTMGGIGIFLYKIFRLISQLNAVNSVLPPR